LSCTPPDESLREYVQTFITPLTGPEIIVGSTRMKAGTATKLILNQITTAAMIRLGKVYDNWMIDVQVTNAKLLERARRMVAEIADVDTDTAASALSAAGNDLRVAVVMLRRKVSFNEAKALLDAHDGSLRLALQTSDET
ncbi:MAG: N-acetylmuramic acid 6-phosphate etherase, partial [Candidatus Poribacteria bacterium]|nr:N-acetylmuramic acid 6-phosphate etherase [Candidatus Poribacteria bacterium]